MERDASRFVFFPWLCCGGFFGPFCFIHSLTHSLPLVLLSFRLLLRSRFSRFSEGAKKKKTASEFDSLFVLGGGKGPWKKKKTPADQAATILLVLPVLSVLIQLVFSISNFFSPRVESCRFIGGFARGPFRSVCLLRYLSYHFRGPGFVQIQLSGPTRVHERQEFVRAHCC